LQLAADAAVSTALLTAAFAILGLVELLGLEMTSLEEWLRSEQCRLNCSVF
jgi:hypothetical protein